MPAEVVRIHSIRKVFREFLGWRLPTLEPEVVSAYRDCIGLFEASIDRHASRGLAGVERTVFRSHYMPGRGYRHRFSEVFGPEKIPSEIRYFLNRFLARAGASEDVVNHAPCVVADLCAWLVWRGYVSDELMENAIDDLQPPERARGRARKHGSAPLP